MKFLVALAVVVACASAAPNLPAGREKRSEVVVIPIVRSSSVASPDGNNFQYNYETGNGISEQVEGYVKEPNTDKATLEIKGSVSYTAPDGTPVNLGFVANELGFVPVGSHLPESPPIPEAILRGLQYIADHPAPVEPVLVKKY